MAKYAPKAARSHTKYYGSDGGLLPGVTTIVGQRAKHLEAWVAKLVKDGYDYHEYMRHVAGIGTCAHEMVMADLSGRKPDIANFTQDQISWARNCHQKVIEWATRPGVNLKLLEHEVQLTSEVMKVGGTMDMYVELDGRPGVVDLKTSDSGIYLDNFYQVAAYAGMAMESGRDVSFCGIIRAGKDQSEGLEFNWLPVKSPAFKKLIKGFKALRQAYEDDRWLKKTIGVK